MSIISGKFSLDDFKYSPSTLDGYSDDDLLSCTSERTSTGKMKRRDILASDTDNVYSFYNRSRQKRYHPYTPPFTPESIEPLSRDSVWLSRDQPDNDGNEESCGQINRDSPGIVYRDSPGSICRESPDQLYKQRNHVLFIDPESVKYLLGKFIVREEPGTLKVSVTRTQHQRFVSRAIIFVAMFMLLLSVLMVVVSLMTSSAIDDMGELVNSYLAHCRDHPVRQANTLLSNAVIPTTTFTTTFPSNDYLHTAPVR